MSLDKTEDSEWVVFDEADNVHVDVDNAMSQSYIDIGESSHFPAPYCPEFECPSIDRSLVFQDVAQQSDHAESSELTNTVETCLKQDQQQHKESQDENYTDDSENCVDDLPWWKRMVKNNGLSMAAVAVGAASVLAIAMTRASHNK